MLFNKIPFPDKDPKTNSPLCPIFDNLERLCSAPPISLEENKIKVEENELQGDIQKQLRMMPGQEKFLMEYYQKNPSAVASLRGTIYEDKIINHLITKAKVTKKKINKEQADKLLKEQNEKDIKKAQEQNTPKKETTTKKTSISKKSAPTKKKQVKKVSKK